LSALAGGEGALTEPLTWSVTISEPPAPHQLGHRSERRDEFLSYCISFFAKAMTSTRVVEGVVRHQSVARHYLLVRLCNIEKRRGRIRPRRANSLARASRGSEISSAAGGGGGLTGCSLKLTTTCQHPSEPSTLQLGQGTHQSAYRCWWRCFDRVERGMPSQSPNPRPTWPPAWSLPAFATTTGTPSSPPAKHASSCVVDGMRETIRSARAARGLRSFCS
jgi:hypothetical protein